MPALTDTRDAYLRITTRAFINDDPQTIVLYRQTKIKKPGGGHDFPKIPLPPQTFRFINQGTGSGISTGLDDGTARSFDYVLVGSHDADVDLNDTFELNGIPYQVTSIIPNNGWETRFYVSGFAEEPEHG